MSTPPNQQSDEYLQARIESCRLLGLNPDDLSAHEAIRADLATVLRLWLDGSQSTLLAGGNADPVKLLSVVEALTKLVPEREHRSHIDPRRIMFETYMGMRKRGELADPTSTFEGQRRRIGELEAEIAALKAGAPVPTPAGDNVVALRPSPTADKSAVSSPPASAAPAAPEAEEFEDVVIEEVVAGPAEPWRQFISSDGSIMSRPGSKYWGPVGS
jgi:hypothetical protein